jgi:hypothetical protein
MCEGRLDEELGRLAYAVGLAEGEEEVEQDARRQTLKTEQLIQKSSEHHQKVFLCLNPVKCMIDAKAAQMCVPLKKCPNVVT